MGVFVLRELTNTTYQDDFILFFNFLEYRCVDIYGHTLVAARRQRSLAGEADGMSRHDAAMVRSGAPTASQLS